MHRDYYHRKLPHIQPLNGTFFVTYRLHGSLPIKIRRQLQEELAVEKEYLKQQGNNFADALDILNRRYFGRYDLLLDACCHGPIHLSVDDVAQIIVDSLRYWDGERMELIAYVVMSNHVHAVFTLLGDWTKTDESNSLERLMQSLKSFSGRKANELLNLTGKFWAEESYDRLVRDDGELIRIVTYVLNNPVEAGLCKRWRDSKWCYVKPEYDMF